MRELPKFLTESSPVELSRRLIVGTLGVIIEIDVVGLFFVITFVDMFSNEIFNRMIPSSINDVSHSFDIIVLPG
jgi:hypothetical protein